MPPGYGKREHDLADPVRLSSRTIPSIDSFQQYRDRVIAAVRAGDNQAALELAEAAREMFTDPVRGPFPWFWVARSHAKLGHADEAVTTVEEAVRRNLVWRLTMYEDPDLDGIRDHPRFKRAMAAVRKRLDALGATAQLFTWEPSAGATEPPLLLGLHGANAHAGQISLHFAGLAAGGWLVAALQSSQPSNPGLFCWDDPERTARDLRYALTTLAAGHRYDPGRVVLAGFSQGGAVAIGSACQRDPVPVAAFLGVCASLNDPWIARLLERDPPVGLRGHLLSGSQDPWVAGARNLHAELTRRGFAVGLEIVDGTGHDFPPGFERQLPRIMTHLDQR